MKTRNFLGETSPRTLVTRRLNSVLIPVVVRWTNTVFSRLNAEGVYLKLGLVDPAFIRTRRLFIDCIFRPFSAIHFFYQQYWRFVELRTKFQQNR